MLLFYPTPVRFDEHLFSSNVVNIVSGAVWLDGQADRQASAALSSAPRGGFFP
jgi:hypothetical protein